MAQSLFDFIPYVWHLVVQGFNVALSNKVVSSRYTEYLLSTLCVLIGTLWTCMGLYIPYKILTMFLSILFPIQSPSFLSGVFGLMWHASMFIPLLATCVFHLLRPRLNEEIYFSTLQKVDPILYERTKDQHFSAWIWWKRYGKRMTRIVLLSIAFFSLSCVPYIGKWLVLIAQYFLLRKAMPQIAAVSLCILAAIPAFSGWITLGLKLWFATHSLFFELLDPHLRLLSSSDRHAQVSANLPLVLTFMFPFTLLLSIPFVGWTLFPVAQGAVTVLAAKLAATHVEDATT